MGFFHQVTLRWIGAIIILGIAVSGAFFVMGYILRRTSGEEHSGSFRAFAHWLTGVLRHSRLDRRISRSGGRGLTLSAACRKSPKITTNTSAHHRIGLVLIIALWTTTIWKVRVIRVAASSNQNMRRLAGEKLVFWFALGAGAAVTVSGVLLLFPFYVTNIVGMQIAQVVYAVIAVLFVSVIIAHIYIGTLGMEGAFEAMATGGVDLNWAKEHHDIWLEEQLSREPLSARSGQSSPAPAE
jgi:formate dehydrogenase subunit gamma